MSIELKITLQDETVKTFPVPEGSEPTAIVGTLIAGQGFWSEEKTGENFHSLGQSLKGGGSGMSEMNAEQARSEQSGLEVQEADAAARAADVAIAEYLSVHPNAHRIQGTPQGLVVRLNAMTADLELTALERRRDEAKERFWHAQREYSDLKEKLNPSEVYIGGHKRS